MARSELIAGELDLRSGNLLALSTISFTRAAAGELDLRPGVLLSLSRFRPKRQRVKQRGGGHGRCGAASSRALTGTENGKGEWRGTKTTSSSGSRLASSLVSSAGSRSVSPVCCPPPRQTSRCRHHRRRNMKASSASGSCRARGWCSSVALRASRGSILATTGRRPMPVLSVTVTDMWVQLFFMFLFD